MLPTMCCIVQGLLVVVKRMQNVVLLIFKVSEHDNQPELEHELLPQYVIGTGEHDGNVCFFRNDILQYETATQNMSSAEDHPIRSWIFLGHITFQIGILSPTPRTKPS